MTTIAISANNPFNIVPPEPLILDLLDPILLPLQLSIDIPPVTDVNYENHQFLAPDQINNAIGAQPIRVTAFKFSHQRLALKRILLQIV
jgi:hypothetical protein